MPYLDTYIPYYTVEEVGHAISLLPEWRREQAIRFKNLAGRKECAYSFLLLAKALHEDFGIEEIPPFAYNEHGKPYLQDHPDIHFSISHCKSTVGCTICDVPCGFDVETIRPISNSLVKYCMNQEETDMILSSSSPNLQFTRLWTQKEAVFKCLGTGITDDLKYILSSQHLQGIRLITTELPEKGFVWSEAKMITED